MLKHQLCPALGGPVSEADHVNLINLSEKCQSRVGSKASAEIKHEQERRKQKQCFDSSGLQVFEFGTK